MELIVPPFAEMFAVPLLLLLVCALAAVGLRWPWAAGLSRIWAGILALFLAFSMGFAYWGLPPFYGGKTPTNCCPTLQH